MPIPLRSDFDAARVRQAARASQDANQVRRLLSLAAIYEGATRSRAAEIGGVTLQIVRDWVLKFNRHGPLGLIDRRAPGQPSRLNASHRTALATVVEAGPDPAVHGVVRWRIIDLCRWVWEQFQIRVSKQTLSRELRAMGFRKLSARPRHHAQVAGAIEEFKKNSQRHWMRSRASKVSAKTTSKSGSPTKHVLVRRTRLLAAGPGAAAGPQHRATSAPAPPTSSAPSAPEQGRPLASSCPGATLTQ
jgi:transposase